MRVRNTIPPTAPYPHRAIKAGIVRLGLHPSSLHECGDDVLITWSPWYGTHREAEARKHRVVIVVENGWFSPLSGRPLYQVNLWGWNGQGCADESRDPARLLGWGPPVQRPLTMLGGPWLVVASRGGGDDPRAMPKDWPDRAVARLAGTAGRQVMIHYKGTDEPPTDVLERLKPAAVVTWNSSFSSWSLWHGVPTFYCGPSISAWRVAKRWHEDMAMPARYVVDPERVREEFYRLAWSQWSEAELYTGEPFARLLNI